MNRCHSAMAAVMLLVVVMTTTIPGAQAAPVEGRWVLVDVQDYPNQEQWDKANTSAAYAYEQHYARGTYSVKTTYKGKTDSYYTPPYIHGEALTVHANWSTPPQVIKAGESVVLHLKLGVLSNSQSALKFSGSARAYLGGANMVNAAGKHFFECTFGTKYASVNETVSAVAKSGSKEGAKLELELTFYSSINMSTKFIYEWTSANKTPVDPLTHNWQPATPKPGRKIEVDEAYAGELYPPGPIYDHNGDLLDTGIRASDLYGECTYQLPTWDEDRWELLELGTILPVNAIVRTQDEGGVILSMPDMTTFELKPGSTLILTQRTGKRNVMKILAGNVVTNIKKILTDGTMEVEMSQAIAGARGTTFVCSEDENGSTLKVLEGTVDFTPNGKVPVVLKAGEAINTKHGVVGEVVKFSAAKELATWSSKTQERIKGVLAAQGIALAADPVAVPATTVGKEPSGPVSPAAGTSARDTLLTMGAAAVVLASAAVALAISRRKC